MEPWIIAAGTCMHLDVHARPFVVARDRDRCRLRREQGTAVVRLKKCRRPLIGRLLRCDLDLDERRLARDRAGLRFTGDDRLFDRVRVGHHPLVHQIDVRGRRRDEVFAWLQVIQPVHSPVVGRSATGLLQAPEAVGHHVAPRADLCEWLRVAVRPGHDSGDDAAAHHAERRAHLLSVGKLDRRALTVRPPLSVAGPQKLVAAGAEAELSGRQTRKRKVALRVGEHRTRERHRADRHAVDHGGATAARRRDRRGRYSSLRLPRRSTERHSGIADGLSGVRHRDRSGNRRGADRNPPHVHPRRVALRHHRLIPHDGRNGWRWRRNDLGGDVDAPAKSDRRHDDHAEQPDATHGKLLEKRPWK